MPSEVGDRRGTQCRAPAGFRLAPALLAKFGDLTRKAHQRVFDPMPVRVALLLHDSLIVVLGDFPTGRAGRANMKGSDAISAHKRGREQRSRHWCLSMV